MSVSTADLAPGSAVLERLKRASSDRRFDQ
jgi:hypothetical protein